MRIIRKKILSVDEFQSFRKAETERAKEAISETIYEFEKTAVLLKCITPILIMKFWLWDAHRFHTMD